MGDEVEQTGGPEHGAVFEDTNPNPAPNAGNENENRDDEPVTITRKQLEDFQNTQAQMMEAINKLNKPATTQQQADPAPSEKPSDKVSNSELKHLGMTRDEFDQAFWDDPAGMMERVMERATTIAQTAAKQQTTQSDFWADFYKKNEDLNDERDIVNMVLNSNMSTLADMPVTEASKKLAELTRNRIMKYTKKDPREMQPGKKVFTEGTENSIPKGKAPQAPAVTSLGDVIRSRREARRSGKAVAT